MNLSGGTWCGARRPRTVTTTERPHPALPRTGEGFTSRSILLPLPPGIALGVEQSREVVVLDPRIRGGGGGGLGVVGDAEAGRLEHRNVVGAVADRERVPDLQPKLGGGVEQGAPLGLSPDDRLAYRAGEAAAAAHEPVGDHPVEADLGANRLGEAGEAARDEDCQRAVAPHRSNQRAGAGGEADSFLAAAVDRGFVEI